MYFAFSINTAVAFVFHILYLCILQYMAYSGAWRIACFVCVCSNKLNRTAVFSCISASVILQSAVWLFLASARTLWQPGFMRQDLHAIIIINDNRPIGLRAQTSEIQDFVVSCISCRN